MPITKSAKKALRQNRKRRAQNLKRKTGVKVLLKEGRKLIEQKRFQEAQKLLPQIAKALDKAVKRGVIKKNTASRKKSRFAKLIQKAAVSPVLR